MAGFSNLTAANTNTGSGMRRLIGAQTAPFSIPDIVQKNIQGDDYNIDSFLFAPTDTQQGILEVALTDTTAEAAMDGVTKDTVGVYDFLGRGSTIANPASMMFLLTRQAHGQDSGNSGLSGFENELILYARTKALGDNTKAFQAEGKMRYQATFNESRLTPYGASSQTKWGVASRLSMIFTSTYRAMFHCYIADGIATEATAFDYTPISAATTKAWNVVTGAALTVSSVDTASKKPTLSAAPASGVAVLFVYQTASFS